MCLARHALCLSSLDASLCVFLNVFMETTSDQTPGFDFQNYLRNELTQRCRSNTAYSLRAFARDLEVEPSALSKILNGKRTITAEMKERFGRKLNLSREQLRALNCAGATVDPTYKSLAEDSFKIISDWHHFAILELTKVEGFRPDTAWIAKSLGLPKAEASEAINRLKRIGFLNESEGQLKDTSGDVTTVDHQFTNVAFKNLQRQVLHQAMQALDNTALDQRDQSSMTMAIDSTKLPQAKTMIKKFRRDLSAFLENGKQRDAVYQLSVSLFPMTNFKAKIRDN